VRTEISGSRSQLGTEVATLPESPLARAGIYLYYHTRGARRDIQNI
jgi:hypothetical protein